MQIRYEMKYGTCDGVGPYTMYVSEVNPIEAILKSKIDPANVISIAPVQLSKFANSKKKSFEDWCDSNNRLKNATQINIPNGLALMVQQIVNIQIENQKALIDWIEEELLR